MKNNKQRADIIMDRYSKNIQPTAEHKTKKTAWWKVATALVCSFILIFTASLGLYNLFGKKHNNFDIDKMYIANFKSYNAIGSGYIENFADNTTKNTKVLKAATNDDNNTIQYLIGKKLDGTIEKLAFSKEQDGNADKEQDQGYIQYVRSFTDFTFFQWSSTPYYGLDNYSFYNDYDGLSKDYRRKIFVIDHKTGKIFDLALNTNIKHISFRYGGAYSFESENYLYFTGSLESNFEPIIYRMSIKDNELLVEEILDKNTLGFNASSAFADKYGNLFIPATNINAPQLYNKDAGFYIDIIPVKYVITTDNKIKRIDKNLFRSTNGIVYTEDKTLKIDSNGELIENSFNNCNVVLFKGNLIKTVGNTEYYYNNKSYYSGYHFYGLENTIFKITWLNEEEFNYEKIKMDDYSSNFALTKDYLYFCTDERVFSINIETGKKQELVSEYIFTSISTDNLGNVIFTALNTDMNNITGIIKNDGEIDISQSARRYKVYYIKPIN